MTAPMEFIKQVDDTHEVTIQLPDDFPRGAVKITVESLSAPNTDDLPWEDRPWTDTELAQALVHKPATLGEILNSGLVGIWENEGITDSQAWIDEVRRQAWKLGD